MVNVVSILLVFFGAFLGAVATLIIKKGTDKHSFLRVLFSRYVWGGGLLYAAGAIIYVIALQKEELSVIYPIASTGYVWATLLSVKYLNEKLNTYKVVSLLGIIVGVVLIGIGG